MKINQKIKWFLLLLVMICGWMGVFWFVKSRNEDIIPFKDMTTYDLLANREFRWDVLMPEERNKGYQSPINFEELWTINEEVIGWLRIPDTAIDYPILFTNNNDTYLHTSIEGAYSVYGSIYLDFQSTPDFTGWHNVIYGHNMRNGSMFRDIVKYKEKDFYDSHQEIYIYTPEREIRLQPIAVFPIRAEWWIRTTAFDDDDGFRDFAKRLTGYHKFGDVEVTGISRLYTFITCSYEWEDTRTLLVAIEVD